MFLCAWKFSLFLFNTRKSTKSIKITKTQISKQATFLTSDVFVRNGAVFFVFCSLVCILCFLFMWNLFVKTKIKRFKTALIPSSTILLMITYDCGLKKLFPAIHWLKITSLLIDFNIFCCINKFFKINSKILLWVRFLYIIFLW